MTEYQTLDRLLAEQNTLNLTKPKPRRSRTQPQPQSGECYAYEVAIPGGLKAQIQRYLDEHKGASFDDVIAQALEAWFAATPPTMGG